MTARATSTRRKKISPKSPRIPKLRHHKASGRAYAVLNGRAVYFGPHGSPEADENYRKTISQWLAAGQQITDDSGLITVKEIVARYWRFARRYYVRPDGRPTSETGNIRQALRPLKELYGQSEAAEFGPLALRTVRQRMIDMGWCRTNINRMVDRIKRLFRWATQNELLPGSVYESLRTVAGLRRGRSDAAESKPVRPVPIEHVEAVKPYVSRQVWAMIRLQLLTAARSGEIVILRPCDVDTSGRIWVYRPAHHKTAHHGHERCIYIGPRAQKVLAPFILRNPKSYCFSPAEARAEYLNKIRLARKTPPQQGNAPGTNRKAKPRKKPGEHYSTSSYGHAIREAIKKAFRPKGMSNERFRKWKAPQHWHPHQLRHNAATELRKEFGLETARIILGHRSPAITEVYAETNEKHALEAMMKVG